MHMNSATGSPVRICYASGTWQLIALCAAIRAHHLRFPDAAATETVVVFSGTGTSPALRETLERLAGLYNELHRFVWIDDLLAELHRFDDVELDAAIGAVRERIGVGSAADVWVNYPWSGPDRFLLEAYPDARVILFEDGVLTYTRPWADAHRLRSTTRETLRYVARRVVRDPYARVKAFHSETRLFGRRRRALHASYLLLGDLLGVPRVHRTIAHVIEPAILRGVLESVPVDRAMPDRGDRPRALILGANFSAWNVIPLADELAMYADIVTRVADGGYEVWWKDHPRILEPFHPALQDLLPDVTIHRLQVDSTLPLEAVLLNDPVDLIVAGLSSGLFYTPLITTSKVRTATFVEAARPLLKWPWLDVADLIQAHVPTLDSVLANTSSGDLRLNIPA
jgi:hypothetical protein